MGIGEEYSYWCGNIGKPKKMTITYSKTAYAYIEKDGEAYKDCFAYYGLITNDWDDEMLEQKASEIPWEEVIAVNVSAA